MPWSFTGRMRDRYPALSHEGLADVVGTVPSYRKAFPTQLRELAAAIGRSADELVVGHTFLPFALPELSAEDATRLSSSMLDDTFPLCVPATLKHPGEFRLRVCLRCMEADEARFGVAYYHRAHQVQTSRHCCIRGHNDPLRETSVTASTRDYMPPTSAVCESRSLDVGDYSIAWEIVTAYNTLAEIGAASCTREQARAAFIEMARREGHWTGTTVSHSLARRIRGRHGTQAFSHFGLVKYDDLNVWLTVPGLAVACGAYGVPFDRFIETARRMVVPPSPPAPPTARQIELFDEVCNVIPTALDQLRRTSSRVTIWSLSRKIDAMLGISFSTNWSWRSPFREHLRQYVRCAHS